MLLALEPGNPLSNRAIAIFFIATDRADQAEPFIKSLAASGAAPFALADFYLLRNRPADAIPHLRSCGVQSKQRTPPVGVWRRLTPWLETFTKRNASSTSC